MAEPADQNGDVEKNTPSDDLKVPIEPIQWKKIFKWIIKSPFRLLWICFLLILLVPIVIIMWCPWTWIASTRPRKRENGNYLQDTKTKKFRREKWDAYKTKHDERNVFAWPGEGVGETGGRSCGSRTWRFFSGRSWGLYELIRECWRTVHRQGLQVFGVIAGLSIILFQLEMMAQDFKNGSILEFVNASYGGEGSNDPHKFLTQGDPLCAYVVGTGIANWSNNKENLIWYGFYHAMLILLSALLIVEECLNVRLGLFAPQSTRMGTGYSIIFLVSATLSTSPNWGITYLIRCRYIYLVALFFGGLLQVLRGLAVGGGFTTTYYAKTTHRHCRHPLRPWTEAEWHSAKDIRDFRKRDKDYRPKYPKIENAQLLIGDLAPWKLGKVKLSDKEKTIDEMQKDDNYFPRVKRKFWHGWPIELPVSEQDKIDVLPKSEFKHKAAFYGKHYWDPWAASEHLGNYTWERNLTRWFNIRRVYAVACAIGLFAVHVGLLVVLFAGSNWSTYRADYSKAEDTWRSNDGKPSGDACQYYSGTTLPILIQLGVSDLKGVGANLFWLGLWHVFIMGMCLAVFLVAFTNNRVFGMHLPWPVTLFGPRTSSNGIGWTLGFVGFATLQLGMFFNQPTVVMVIARAICYNCIISWVIHLGPNERLDNNYIRFPFWRGLSRWAFKHMDKRETFREVHNSHY